MALKYHPDDNVVTTLEPLQPGAAIIQLGIVLAPNIRKKREEVFVAD